MACAALNLAEIPERSAQERNVLGGTPPARHAVLQPVPSSIRERMASAFSIVNLDHRPGGIVTLTRPQSSRIGCPWR